MTDVADQLPGDLASAHAMILAERAARREAQALAAPAQALNSHSDVLIARLRLEIEKLKREIHGSRSERKARLLQQMELQLEELEADASQDELAAELAARSSTVVNAARIFPKSAEVKFPSFAAQTVAEGCPFFGGRPRGRDGGFNVGGVMEAFDRKCSGMSSACWRSR